MTRHSAFALPLLLALSQGVHAAPDAPQIQPVETGAVAHSPVVTRHQGTFNGHTLAYTATVEGQDVATGNNQGVRIVSFAYTRDGADPHTRPVVFLFNGGPIVPSSYIHIGGLGPKRIAFPEDVKADPSSFHLVENSFSPLDAADLVFVDPASTGFSRVLPGTDPHAFFSIRDDARQVVAFMRAWLTQHGRDGAPVFIMGESYGTNRAAEIAGQIADSPEPFPLAGVFLYGQAVNIVEYSQRPANVTSYIASLPTLAAIGWYHGKAARNGRSLDAFMADARAFAKGDYLRVLYQGSSAAPADRARVAARLQALTGIPAAWYLANDLKITKERYRVELLKDQHLLLGRSDARYTAPITDKGGAPDPAEVLSDAVQTIFPTYLRDDLHVDWQQPYTPAVPLRGLDDWGWSGGSSPFSDWPYYQGITRMMARNPHFRVIVGNGMFDTQTTMGAAELLTMQSGWDPARVTLRYYDGGHTGYTVAATARALGQDIRAMIGRR